MNKNMFYNYYSLTEYLNNPDLNYKDYVITLLGYTHINNDGSRHTNWFPWNRFKDVYETIGYKCEWVELKNLIRKDEKRLFVTWNNPTCAELVNSNNYNKGDVIFQKLTSLGKYDNGVNWTSNPHEWNKKWKWTMYKMLEEHIDKGYDVYGFGCKSDYIDYPEKKRICEKLKKRIFWLTWGGTPFNFKEIIESQPNMENLSGEIGFVGSKWGVVGRGNIDAWDKYLSPLDNNYNFKRYGGIGSKMLTDEEMKIELKKYKICPIIHAPSWQAEKGVQDRFYTVFICGRFGICDNLGAVDIFGDEIKDICEINKQKYFDKSSYYLENVKEQEKYIKYIQQKIKTKYNFYIQWYNIMCGKKNF